MGAPAAPPRSSLASGSIPKVAPAATPAVHTLHASRHAMTLVRPPLTRTAAAASLAAAPFLAASSAPGWAVYRAAMSPTTPPNMNSSIISISSTPARGVYLTDQPASAPAPWSWGGRRRAAGWGLGQKQPRGGSLIAIPGFLGNARPPIVQESTITIYDVGHRVEQQPLRFVGVVVIRDPSSHVMFCEGVHLSHSSAPARGGCRRLPARAQALRGGRGGRRLAAGGTRLGCSCPGGN